MIDEEPHVRVVRETSLEGMRADDLTEATEVVAERIEDSTVADNLRCGCTFPLHADFLSLEVADFQLGHIHALISSDNSSSAASMNGTDRHSVHNPTRCSNPSNS